jgi:hypothetical protein
VDLGIGKTPMQEKEKEDFLEVVANLIGRGQVSMEVFLGSKQNSWHKDQKQ